jgi:hypothetical protein
VADDSDPPLRDPRDAAMQRVRVGLTGLAAVFLLTLLAASILGMLGQDEPHGAKLANGSVAANMAADPPKEPLAELGVAPGGNQPKTVMAAPPPAARPIVTIPPPQAPHLSRAAPSHR